MYYFNFYILFYIFFIFYSINEKSLVNCKPILDDLIDQIKNDNNNNGVNNENYSEHFRTKRVSLSIDEENDAQFWHTGAQLTLRDHLLQKQLNTNVAKNVIFFLGDGMSIPTLAAARTYLGQLQGNPGEETQLTFEQFPYVGLSKTYCVDKQVADSACSATAYLTGVKANYGTIGVTARVQLDDCITSTNTANQVNSVLSWAQAAGKSTGIVTTTRITHASPAGTYAHVANRKWECDADVLQYKKDPNECQDIASQLIYNSPGNKMNVIMGGGRKKFLPKDAIDEDGEVGQRDDGVDLINIWKKQKNFNGTHGEYVANRRELRAINFTETDYLLGLFGSDHMNFYLDANHEKEPTLGEMTTAAIKMLEKNAEGFFLFVEGGRIDHGHHQTRAHKALSETVEFSEAVRLATELTNQKDTLIVITADHAHTMSLSGYSKRGENILGLNSKTSDMDNLPYTTLSYANGPAASILNTNGTRSKLSEDSFNKDFQYPANIPASFETHGGDDVGVFALGPWGHLFSGVYEQNTIPHLLGFASCIGDGLTVCNR